MSAERPRRGLGPGAWWANRSPLGVLAVAFLLSLPAVTVRFYASDEIEYFAYLRSMWFDRDLSFDNEYRYFYERGIAQGARPREDREGYYGSGYRQTFLEGTTATGLRVNFAPVGSAVLWAPFYAVADAGVRVARLMGSDVPADGFSRPYLAAVTYGSAVYGFLALVLSGVAVRLIFGATNWTLLAVWLGTPLLFYMYVAPGFSHACSAFTVAAFVVLWLRVRRDWSWSGAATLGAMAAVMGMVREQDLFIAVGPAIDYVVHLGRSVRRGDSLSAGFGAPLAGLLAFAVCYLPQAIAYVVLNGRLGPSPTVAGKMTWTAPYAWQVLASPDHGLLFWTPLALPALLGVAYLGLGRLRDRPALASDVTTRVPDAWVGFLCLLMVMTQFYVTGSLSTWMGAGSFGQRRLVGLTVFFALGLATLYRVARPAWLRHALSGLVVVCVWWNLGLIAQFGVGLMNRQRLEPARNAYDNFVTIPRVLPELAYRYVFDRESFYQTRTRSAP